MEAAVTSIVSEMTRERTLTNPEGAPFGEQVTAFEKGAKTQPRVLGAA